MSRYDNYIFDLYGTLIDIETDEHADVTWIKWCNKLDSMGLAHPSIETFRDDFFERDYKSREIARAEGIFKYPEIDVIPIYYELFTKYGNDNLTDDIVNRASYEFRIASRKRMQLFAGVIEYLGMIKDTKKRAFILSNAQRSYTWPEICEFDLHKITEDQLISSDYGCMKPDVKFFDALIDKYQMDRSRTVMFGDSLENDVGGAIASGIDYVHLIEENNPRQYYVQHLFELL